MGRGALVFKGDDRPKKKKKKVKHHAANTDGASSTTLANTSSSSDPVAARNPEAPTRASSAKESASSSAAATAPKIMKGTGTLTTSGTVVTGYETRFLKELAVGNALLIGTEMRVVTMSLSNSSVNVSSAFSQNYGTPVSFQYIPKPKTTGSSTREEELAAKERMEQQNVSGTYASNNELVYREPTANGSYRIVKKKLSVKDGDMVSRGDLLEMRAKRKSDKYC